MSFPTRLQVKQRFWQLLDDPAGRIFTDLPTPGTPPGPSLFQSAFSEAFDILYNVFLGQQVPRVERVVDGIIVSPFPTTFSLSPAQMGIVDFADWDWIGERAAGSTDNFVDLVDEDRLTQRAPTDRLLETVWQDNAFQFVGCTTVRELQMKYISSGTAPIADDGVVTIDSSLNFLANWAAGTMGGNKGYEKMAAKCRLFAGGPKFDNGVIGGELYRLTAPLVRSRQNVPVAHKPYTTQRRILGRWRGIPYVAAQQGTTGGGAINAPIEYSSANSGASTGIVGVIDGINTVFWLQAGGVMTMQVYRNGLLQTPGVDIVTVNNQITFLAGSIPQPGDTITALAYINWNL